MLLFKPFPGVKVLPKFSISWIQDSHLDGVFINKYGIFFFFFKIFNLILGDFSSTVRAVTSCFDYKKRKDIRVSHRNHQYTYLTYCRKSRKLQEK